MKQEFEKEVRGYEYFFNAHYKIIKEPYYIDGAVQYDVAVVITDIETIQAFRDGEEIFDRSIIRELEKDVLLMELQDEIDIY